MEKAALLTVVGRQREEEDGLELLRAHPSALNHPHHAPLIIATTSQ